MKAFRALFCLPLILSAMAPQLARAQIECIVERPGNSLPTRVSLSASGPASLGFPEASLELPQGETSYRGELRSLSLQAIGSEQGVVWSARANKPTGRIKTFTVGSGLTQSTILAPVLDWAYSEGAAPLGSPIFVAGTNGDAVATLTCAKSPMEQIPAPLPESESGTTP